MIMQKIVAVLSELTDTTVPSAQKTSAKRHPTTGRPIDGTTFGEITCGEITCATKNLGENSELITIEWCFIGGIPVCVVSPSLRFTCVIAESRQSLESVVYLDTDLSTNEDDLSSPLSRQQSRMSASSPNYEQMAENFIKTSEMIENLRCFYDTLRTLVLTFKQLCFGHQPHGSEHERTGPVCLFNPVISQTLSILEFYINANDSMHLNGPQISKPEFSPFEIHPKTFAGILKSYKLDANGSAPPDTEALKWCLYALLMADQMTALWLNKYPSVTNPKEKDNLLFQAARSRLTEILDQITKEKHHTARCLSASIDLLTIGIGMLSTFKDETRFGCQATLAKTRKAMSEVLCFTQIPEPDDMSNEWVTCMEIMYATPTFFDLYSRLFLNKLKRSVLESKVTPNSKDALWLRLEALVNRCESIISQPYLPKEADLIFASPPIHQYSEPLMYDTLSAHECGEASMENGLSAHEYSEPLAVDGPSSMEPTEIAPVESAQVFDPFIGSTLNLPGGPSYTLNRRLGAGTFGIVFHATDSAGNPVAIKIVSEVDGEGINRKPEIINEATQHKKASDASSSTHHALFNQPFVAQLYDFARVRDGSNTFYVMVMELCGSDMWDDQESGQLKLDIKNADNLPPYETILYVLRAILTVIHATSHLSRLGIFHGDIKPESFIRTLASKDATKTNPHSSPYKACDFGLSRSIPETPLRHGKGKAPNMTIFTEFGYDKTTSDPVGTPGYIKGNTPFNGETATTLDAYAAAGTILELLGIYLDIRRPTNMFTVEDQQQFTKQASLKVNENARHAIGILNPTLIAAGLTSNGGASGADKGHDKDSNAAPEGFSNGGSVEGANAGTLPSVSGLHRKFYEKLPPEFVDIFKEIGRLLKHVILDENDFSNTGSNFEDLMSQVPEHASASETRLNVPVAKQGRRHPDAVQAATQAGTTASTGVGRVSKNTDARGQGSITPGPGNQGKTTLEPSRALQVVSPEPNSQGKTTPEPNGGIQVVSPEPGVGLQAVSEGHSSQGVDSHGSSNSENLAGLGTTTQTVEEVPANPATDQLHRTDQNPAVVMRLVI